MNLQEKIFSYLSKLQAAFTAATTDIITSSAHGLVNEDLLQFTTTTTLPAGLAASTNYYVRDATTNTFKVSTIKGGPVVDITDTGTGVHTFHLKGKAFFTDGFEHIQLALDTVNSGNFTLKVQGSNSELAPDFNAAQTAINSWDYIDIVDLEDKSSIDGDTGVSVSGSDDHRMFEINVNALRWTSIVITAWTAGTLEAKVKSNKSYN